jgi:hypothetical protein
MVNYVAVIVAGLLTQGYVDKGGSDVFRILVHPKTGQHIKVYYNDYGSKDWVVVRESS